MNAKSDPISSAAPDERPLTIAHGRRLFEQASAINHKMDALQPFFQLLEAAPSSTEQDPIAVLVQLLEMISDTQARHDEAIFDMGRKLDAIIEMLAAAGHCSSSAVPI